MCQAGSLWPRMATVWNCSSPSSIKPFPTARTFFNVSVLVYYVLCSHDRMLTDWYYHWVLLIVFRWPAPHHDIGSNSTGHPPLLSLELGELPCLAIVQPVRQKAPLTRSSLAQQSVHEKLLLTCRLRRVGTEQGWLEAGPDCATRSWTAVSASQARKSDAGSSRSGPTWFSRLQTILWFWIGPDHFGVCVTNWYYDSCGRSCPGVSAEALKYCCFGCADALLKHLSNWIWHKTNNYNSEIKNDIRDVGSIADLVLVLLVHLVH